jgi:hypothetical protein
VFRKQQQSISKLDNFVARMTNKKKQTTTNALMLIKTFCEQCLHEPNVENIQKLFKKNTLSRSTKF